MQFYLKTIFEYNYKKTGWGILFQRYFLVWLGKAECIDGNKWVGLYCPVHLYLSVPSCCVHSSLYHIKSLPSFTSLGRSQFFQEAVLSLLSTAPCYTREPLQTFLFVVLCSCVCFSSWYPGMIFRTETKMGQLGSSTCRVWNLVSRSWAQSALRGPSPLAHREHAVQGADRLFVRWLK